MFNQQEIGMALTELELAYNDCAPGSRVREHLARIRAYLNNAMVQPSRSEADRSSILEEAAKLCDGFEEGCAKVCAALDGFEVAQAPYWRADGGGDAAEALAKAIRALKEKK